MYKGLNNSFNLFVKYEVFAKVWVATVFAKVWVATVFAKVWVATVRH